MRRYVKKTRLEQLKMLLKELAVAIDSKPGARDLAGLVRQYRETLKEIEEIEGLADGENEIDKLISG